jgi:hypothetical protein
MGLDIGAFVDFLNSNSVPGGVGGVFRAEEFRGLRRRLFPCLKTRRYKILSEKPQGYAVIGSAAYRIRGREKSLVIKLTDSIYLPFNPNKRSALLAVQKFRVNYYKGAVSFVQLKGTQQIDYHSPSGFVFKAEQES